MAVYLVRHAKAADRGSWEGDDGDRPLTDKGRAQAEGLATMLGGANIERVLSSPALRCVETVQPLADQAGLPVEVTSELAEGEPLGPARRLLTSLLPQRAVLSGHGDLIPALINALGAEGVPVEGPPACKKGSVWVVETDDGRFVRACYRPPPDVSR